GCSTVARAITSMRTTARLPTVRAPVWPDRTGRAAAASAVRAARATSARVGPANSCLTRIIRGNRAARGTPVSIIDQDRPRRRSRVARAPSTDLHLDEHELVGVRVDHVVLHASRPEIGLAGDQLGGGLSGGRTDPEPAAGQGH